MIYDKPYTRLIPYVLGVIVCFIFNDKRYHVNAQNWSAFVRWLTMAVCCGFLLGSMLVYHTNVYGPEGQLASWTPTESAWYNALIHFTWSVPLCVILYLCLCNVGGPINWVLSLPIFEAMGKLTYAAYLLHPILMRITYYSTHQLYYYDVDNVTYFSYCAFFLLVTYALAIPVYVFIEMPFANMIGVALKKKAKK
jgi:peptidoglycan/LPS O-acetylase OafA/YrhL